MKECFLYKVLPKYWKVMLNYWIAIWSAPDIKDKGWLKTLRAMRITVREGDYHSKLIFVVKKGFLILLVILLYGCGSSYSILAWKPTTVVVKDNDVGKTPTGTGTIIITASPTQPTEIHDITGLPTP